MREYISRNSSQNNMSAGLELTKKLPSAVKVFISSLSTSKEAKQQQQRIVLTFDVKKIPYEKKDIAVDPQAKREFRMLMRGYDPKASPPQIFNGDYLCGNYEAFYWAVEDEKLEEFLRLVPLKSKQVTRAAELSTVDAKLPDDEQTRTNCTNYTPVALSDESAAKPSITDTDVSTMAILPPVAPPLGLPPPPGALSGGHTVATPRDGVIEISES